MFLDGAKLHQPGRILLPVSSSRTGRPIARSAEELSSTWPSPADITVDLDHRPNWTERIVALRLRPTVGDLGLDLADNAAPVLLDFVSSDQFRRLAPTAIR